MSSGERLMRIAIHDNPGDPSDVWIAWCEEYDVPYRRVDCFADDIVEQVRDCDGLIWWWARKARPFSYQLTRALETSGKLVFPDSSACWHIDDKIGQKYLFEATGLPFVQTHVFYDKEKALTWAATAKYPKIFKLRSSASSGNVWLVKTPAQAARFIGKAFGRGFAGTRRWQTFTERLGHLRHRKTSGALWAAFKAAVRIVLPAPKGRVDLDERGYAYFQDVVTGVSHAFLILVSDDRAYALRWDVRPGDFRASGSGMNAFGHPENVPEECIERAFEAAEALDVSFLALEMLVTEQGLFIIETDPYWHMKDAFPGFWDSRLQWHEGAVVPARTIIGKFVSDMKAREAAAAREVHTKESRMPGRS